MEIAETSVFTKEITRILTEQIEMLRKTFVEE